ncbi:MAG: adenylosuccinate lyase, partial [Firmicutes bacterium]|nr:adenylosuccinate lyase [Candidatus Onthovivens merdipullorum]
MIDRYDIKEISDLFSLENRYKTFLEIELANLEALVSLNIVPEKDYLKIKAKAQVDVNRINELEKLTKHDVIAFTRSIDENLGDEKRWFHYGLTSTDVVDSALSILYKKASLIILKDIDNLLEAYKEKALTYKDLPAIARTHGMHAEITSFGLRFARFFDELNRNKNRFIEAINELCLIKLEGAVGNFAFINKDVENFVAKKFNLNTPKIATQVIARDNHTNFLNALALIATHIENVSIEFRNLSRNEINEVNEYFSKDQKGSSAMPHKHNPISFENMCGLARVIRGYAFSSYDNIPLYHERDISHSSSERIIFPDALVLTSYILRRMTSTIKKLVINEVSIRNNINLTNRIIFSERVLTYLIDKGISREEAYDKVQALVNDSYINNVDFRENLAKSQYFSKILTNKDLDIIFDESFFLKNTDYIYKRVGLI